VQLASCRLAHHLRHAEGVARGDRVVLVLPQRVESALAHVACSRLGAVTVPLSPLFGPAGLATRIADARPVLALTMEAHRGVVREALDLAKVPAPLRTIQEASFVEGHRLAPPLPAREHAAAGPEDAFTLVYTSGTTGHPKGALLPHRVIPGRMPGFLLAHEPYAEAPALFYSPADWSWIGGLHDSLFAPWHAGTAVLAHERAGPFDPAATFRLMAEHGVTDAFLPPTALKALARGGAEPPGMALRSVHSAGEPLPPPVAAWARGKLAHHVTEVYGLTECAFLVGTATLAYDTPEGSMGRPYPGHTVEVRDGEICARRGDPTMMLGYWQGPDAPPRLPLDDEGWLHTGDVADAAPDGFLSYKGRTDDLIKTGGYRVGPAEVEAALLHHPAVAECAVVGGPDEARGQRVKAYVKLAPRVLASPGLAEQLKAFVRARLAAHAYPREVEFVDALPLTVSGKVKRRELRGAG
jgi:acetyl-CoA synthetase